MDSRHDNINKGKNDELLNNCKPLKEYMILVEQIRQNRKTMDVEEAVDTAVTYCIDHDILRDFLIKHRAEVKDVCITEYNEQVFINGIKEEGREEGLEQGRLLEIYHSVQEGDYSVERGAEKTGMSVAEFEEAMRKALI